MQKRVAIVCPWVLSCAAVLAQAPSPTYNIGEAALAIDGHDPVAYFVDRTATPGSADHVVSYRGIRYRFATVENKRRFLADPEAWVPQYGGWCAFGFAMEPGAFGDWQPGPYPVDPASFLIDDGKLYLFYDATDFDARAHWLRDPGGNRARADARWVRRMSDSVAPRSKELPPGMHPDAPPQTAELAWFLGEWEVVWRMKSRPDAPEFDIVTRAVWKASFTFDGFAIVDEFTAPDLAATLPWGDFRGMTFRAFDPSLGKWIMSYQQVNGSDAWRLEGTMTDGRFAIEARSVVADRRYRPVFFDIRKDRFSWKNDVSLDGGKTWHEGVAQATATRIR